MTQKIMKVRRLAEERHKVTVIDEKQFSKIVASAEPKRSKRATVR